MGSPAPLQPSFELSHEMRRTILTLLPVVALAVVAFVASGAVLQHDRPAAPKPGRSGPQTAGQTVTAAQNAIRADPQSDRAYATLASAALERVRETGDPSWYAKADEAGTRALAIAPRNVQAIDALATLANARHRFAEGLHLATQSTNLEPDHFAPLGLAADALIELGRYREGFATVERSLRLKPNAASYSRASYVAELRGDRTQAIALMALAVESGRPGSESRAWSRVQLGLLHFGSGNLSEAAGQMRTALAERPGDARATAGSARIEAARGHLDRAASLYQAALDTTPLPEYAASLLDVDRARGAADRLPGDVELLRAMERLQEQAGVRIDLDRALIDADQHRPTATDVTRARAAHMSRPGIIGDDILGWVLTRANRCDEGLRYARRSLRLGTRDALMLFHAGAAAHCAGATADARVWLAEALHLNPAFSVRWAPVARRMLTEVTS